MLEAHTHTHTQTINAHAAPKWVMNYGCHVLLSVAKEAIDRQLIIIDMRPHVRLAHFHTRAGGTHNIMSLRVHFGSSHATAGTDHICVTSR